MANNKIRLMELAGLNSTPAINNLKEAIDPNFPVKLTVTVKAGDLINMFGGPESIALALKDPIMFKKFTDTVQNDLNDWFVGAGGDEWINDGVEQGVYDDFMPMGYDGPQ